MYDYAEIDAILASKGSIATAEATATAYAGPTARGILTREAQNELLSQSPEYTQALAEFDAKRNAILEQVGKAYLKSLSYVTVIPVAGVEITLENPVEVSKHWAKLNEWYKKARTVEDKVAYEAAKIEIEAWLKSHGINTQRGNAQTKEGVGMVALRKYDLS